MKAFFGDVYQWLSVKVKIELIATNKGSPHCSDTPMQELSYLENTSPVIKTSVVFLKAKIVQLNMHFENLTHSSAIKITQTVGTWAGY